MPNTEHRHLLHRDLSNIHGDTHQRSCYATTGTLVYGFTPCCMLLYQVLQLVTRASGCAKARGIQQTAALCKVEHHGKTVTQTLPERKGDMSERVSTMKLDSGILTFYLLLGVGKFPKPSSDTWVHTFTFRYICQIATYRWGRDVL